MQCYKPLPLIGCSTHWAAAVPDQDAPSNHWPVKPLQSPALGERAGRLGCLAAPAMRSLQQVRQTDLQQRLRRDAEHDAGVLREKVANDLRKQGSPDQGFFRVPLLINTNNPHTAH